MRLDNYQKLVDADRFLQKERGKDTKKDKSAVDSSSHRKIVSFFRCCGNKVRRCYLSINRKRTGASNALNCGPADWMTLSRFLSVPSGVTESSTALGIHCAQFSPFLFPFRSSKDPSLSSVPPSSGGWAYWFLFVLRCVTLALLAFCVVGTVYLWRYPLLPLELIWIEGILVEVEEEETWIESCWKGTGLWRSTWILVFLSFLAGHWPSFFEWIKLVTSPLSEEKNGKKAYSSPGSTRKNGISDSSCTEDRDIRLPSEGGRKDDLALHAKPLNHTTTICHTSTLLDFAQPIPSSPSFFSSRSNYLQPFIRTFSSSPIRSLKELDRFLRSTQSVSAAQSNTSTSPRGNGPLTREYPSFSKGKEEKRTALPGKSALAKTSPLLGALTDDEKKKRNIEVSKMRALLPWGHSCLPREAGRDTSSLGSIPAPVPSVRLAGCGLGGGIRVCYNETIGREVEFDRVSHSVDPLGSSKVMPSSVGLSGNSTGYHQGYSRQMDGRDSYVLHGVNEAVWAGLGMMDAFHVRASVIKLKERFQQICTELLQQIEASNAWLRARDMGAFDCSHSLEETYMAAEAGGLGSTGGFRAGMGGGGSLFGSSTVSNAAGGGGGQGGFGFRPNTAVGGFGQNNLLSSSPTSFGGGVGASPAAKITKKMYLLQEKDKLRQQCQQTTAGSGLGGAGGGSMFGSTTSFRPSSGFMSTPSPVPAFTRAEMVERIERLNKRLELEEKLNVFNTFPLLTAAGSSSNTTSTDGLNSTTGSGSVSGSAGGTGCQQQQEYLLHRVQMWASPALWNPRTFSSEKSLTEDVGAAASAEIWYDKNSSDPQAGGRGIGTGRSRAAPPVENDAYLMLHLLRYGIEGLSSFIRSGCFSSSSRVPELCICPGDVGIPYFYVLLRTSTTDVSLSMPFEASSTVSDPTAMAIRISGGRAAVPHQRLSSSQWSCVRRQLPSGSFRQHVPRDYRTSGASGGASATLKRTIRMNVAAWLKKLQSSQGSEHREGEAVSGSILASTGVATHRRWPSPFSLMEGGIGTEGGIDDVYEEEEVVLSTTPGPHSLWEALLVFICIVHRFYGGAFHSARGTMDLEYNGLVNVVAPFSTVLSNRVGGRKQRSTVGTAEPEGWLHGRSLFSTSKDIVE